MPSPLKVFTTTPKNYLSFFASTKPRTRKPPTRSAQAITVWSAPTLDATVLEAYKPKAIAARYAIEDHPHLVAGPMHNVFEAFRKEVLALDPCVTEEFRKLYVAYKAE